MAQDEQAQQTYTTVLSTVIYIWSLNDVYTHESKDVLSECKVLITLYHIPCRLYVNDNTFPTPRSICVVIQGNRIFVILEIEGC